MDMKRIKGQNRADMLVEVDLLFNSRRRSRRVNGDDCHEREK